MNNSLVKLYRLFLFILAISLLYLVWPYISNVVMILALVFLFATVLLPAVDWLEGKIRSRMLAVILVLLAVLAVLGTFVTTFAVQLSNEAVEFSNNLDKQQLNKTLSFFTSGTIDKLPDFLKDFTDQQLQKMDISSKIADFVQSVISKLASLAKGLGSVLFLMFMTLIFTVILLYEYHNFKRALVNILPNKYLEVGLQLIYKIEKQVSGYLGGQLLAALSVAVMSIIGLVLLNLIFDANLSLIIFVGIIAGLSNLIPLIGPIVGMLPAIFIAVMNNLQNPAAMESFFYIPHIIITFIIVQQIDSNIVSPTVVGKSVGMHPIVVLIALLIGGSLIGPLGMLLAVPIAGVIKVVTQQILWLTAHSKNL